MAKSAIHIDNAPQPAGPYSQAVVANGFLYTAGFGPQDPATGAVPESVADQTRQVLRNYRKDGTHFWNELSLSTVYNNADKQTYFVGVQKDVTTQVKAQQRVTQLEAQVAELTAQLAALRATSGSNKL